MKKIIAISLLLCLSASLFAQTFAEWFKQKDTQKKYLMQQIAALQVYAGYVSKGYSIVKKGLYTIQDTKQGDLNLHEIHFSSFVSVNPKIKHYAKVADILALEISITSQTAKTIKDCKNSGDFSTTELIYLHKVFNAVLNDCAASLDALFNIITNGQLSMQDDERIAAIDQLYNDMEDKQVFIQSFSNTSRGLCLQRENDHRDITISKKLNDLK